MVELESSAEMMLPVRSCLSSFAAEISSSFGWKVPTGSDDGGDGNKSNNSVEVLTMSFPLIRTFNRLITSLTSYSSYDILKFESLCF